MSSNDDSRSNNPVEGKGEEMLPERGLPFDDDQGYDDIGENVFDDLGGEEPRDVSPEELAAYVGEGDEAAIVPASSDPIDEGSEENGEENENEGRDGGLGAIYPVLDDEELAGEVGPPAGELEVPPQRSVRGMPVYGERALLDPGFASAFEREGTRHLEGADEMADLFITRDRLERLWLRMDKAQEEVREQIPSLAIARELVDQIERARNELLSGRSNYEEAERSISEVELRVSVTQRSIKESRFGYWLLVYELFWAVFLTIALVWAGPLVRDITLAQTGPDALNTFPTLSSDTLLLVNSGIAGGIGGVIGALYALWKHISREIDFSRQYALWYYTNPILGTFLGAFVFLVVRAGMISLTVGSDTQEITSPFVLYMIAFIVGYQQHVAYDLIRRIIRVLFQLSEDNERDSAQASTIR